MDRMDPNGQRLTFGPREFVWFIEEDAWVDRQASGRPRHTFSRADFIGFIETPAPKGLGTNKDAIRRYLGGSSNTLRTTFEELAEAKQGAPLGNRNNVSGLPKPKEPEREPNPNNVRVWVPDEGGGPVINYSAEVAPPPSRDRTREPKAGNAIGYTVRRLIREVAEEPEGPSAVPLARLQAGEISANAAAVLAGHRLRSITIPADPRAAARRLARHFTPLQFEELVRAYREAGDEGVSPADEGGDR